MQRKVTLTVPYRAQPDSSSYCSAACSQMVLEFHGQMLTLPQLVKEIGVSQAHGALMTDIGRWFCERGFDVTIVACPVALPPRLAYLPQEKLMPEMRRWCQRSAAGKNPLRHRLSRSLTRFYDAGGKFEYRPVQWRDIGSALGRREPPILNVTMSSYAPARTWNAGHYVVPTGINRAKLDFHDPMMGPMSLPREHALHVCHVRHGGAVFISPRSPA